MVKKILLAFVALLLLLATVVAVNTLRKTSHQLQVPAMAPLALDKTAAAERLGQAVRFSTISSRDDAKLNTEQFKQLHAYLEAKFPLTHANLKREVVADLSLLYTWQGSDPQAQPILLMAHQDVVPVAPGTEGDWQLPPDRKSVV